MALIAEEIVQEWLQRDGYFTLRGVRQGGHEIDLLAIRLTQSADGLQTDCRHVEVQVSSTPVSYLTRKSARNVGDDVLRASVDQWIHTKYRSPLKQAMRNRFFAGPWREELVIHDLKHPIERTFLEEAGVVVRDFRDVLGKFGKPKRDSITTGGEVLLELIRIASDCGKKRAP